MKRAPIAGFLVELEGQAETVRRLAWMTRRPSPTGGAVYEDNIDAINDALAAIRTAHEAARRLGAETDPAELEARVAALRREVRRAIEAVPAFPAAPGILRIADEDVDPDAEAWLRRQLSGLRPEGGEHNGC